MLMLSLCLVPCALSLSLLVLPKAPEERATYQLNEGSLGLAEIKKDFCLWLQRGQDCSCLALSRSNMNSKDRYGNNRVLQGTKLGWVQICMNSLVEPQP